MILSPLQSPQNQRKCAISAVGTLLFFGMVFYTQRFYLASEKPMPQRVYNEAMQPGNVPRDLPELVQQLWKPTLHPMNDTHFVSDEGYRYDIPKDAHRWSKPLGKKLLILDVDTRMNDGPGDLMNQNPLDHKNMTGRTGGWLDHQLYAMIHGYDYRLVRAPNYEGRHGTWVKVPMIKEALKTHEIVVFLDADAVFMYKHMPFEWLMSMWNFTPDTLVAMAEDPNSKRNRDHNGWVMWNTGFIVAQQSNRTQELFDVWDRCPTNEKYETCGHWDKDWAHEQAAFSNHVRYDYNATDELRVIPCMDGNGAPYIGDKKCGGVFIRHHWFHKDWPIRNLRDSILDLVVRRLHSHFHAEKQDYYLDAHKESYPLPDLQI
ncbi:hypothetical protein G7Z17_g1406 [Cylindrodendrum hubeiense]|uniref:Nucleotide-diphospho-sugar transferase domain-containing protein n=1 Tax=Cylindrodendrum hubeiense TaxID=595255 RepID=A0A9P5HEV8_9HYPO|nr:hypothetical protein G7Z17_g1406 [Cylindrodendrum hubeiense]